MELGPVVVLAEPALPDEIGILSFRVRYLELLLSFPKQDVSFSLDFIEKWSGVF